MNIHSVRRDQCFGRRLARAGAAPLVLSEAKRPPPTNAERVLSWRLRAKEPGMGNRYFDAKS